MEESKRRLAKAIAWRDAPAALALAVSVGMDELRARDTLTGGTPLELCSGWVGAESAEVAAMILERGAPMWAEDALRRAPLAMAMERGNELVALALIRAAQARGELSQDRANEALRRGCARWMGAGAREVWALLEAGADPDDAGPKAGDRSARAWSTERPTEERERLAEAFLAYDERRALRASGGFEAGARGLAKGPRLGL